MDTLSKEKLNSYKEKKGLSNRKISDLTGLPISTIDKIFSGSNKNPTLDTLKKIADLFDCSIDDFIIYEREPLSDSYVDAEVMKIARILQKNSKLKELMIIAKDLSTEDIKLITAIAKRLAKKY